MLCSMSSLPSWAGGRDRCRGRGSGGGRGTTGAGEDADPTLTPIRRSQVSEDTDVNLGVGSGP